MVSSSNKCPEYHLLRIVPHEHVGYAQLSRTFTAKMYIFSHLRKPIFLSAISLEVLQSTGVAIQFIV